VHIFIRRNITNGTICDDLFEWFQTIYDETRSPNNEFGLYVAISDNASVISVSTNNVGGSGSGRFSIFTYNGTAWQFFQAKTFVPGTETFTRTAISQSQSIVLGLGNSDAADSNRGETLYYSRNTSDEQWFTPNHEFSYSVSTPNDYFNSGYSVDVSDHDTAIIGSLSAVEGSNIVFIFKKISPVLWNLTQTLTTPVTGQHFFGILVKISRDAQVILVLEATNPATLQVYKLNSQTQQYSNTGNPITVSTDNEVLVAGDVDMTDRVIIYGDRKKGTYHSVCYVYLLKIINTFI
jgi:hypothetical protein